MNILITLKILLIEILIINSILSAILVIISKNPVISVIFLISLILNSALFIIVKGMPFLGISYILVYLGAIIVLFLFVIMMINVKLTDILETGYQYTKNIPLALAVSGLFIYEILNLLPTYLNSPVFQIESSSLISLFSSIIKEIVITINSYLPGAGVELNSIIGYQSLPGTGNLSNALQGLNEGVREGLYDPKENILPLLSNNNWPETLISNNIQIVSVAYNLYTYCAFWFILLSMILLLAMIAPIYLSKKTQ